MRSRFLLPALHALGLLTCTLPARAAETSSDAPDPGSVDAGRDTGATTESHHVLFVLGAGDAEAADAESLKAAVEAQLAGSTTTVEFVTFEGSPETLREQVIAARTLAANRGAMGVFWLEMAKDGDWLLYLAEPEADRILVRRLEVKSASAGTEVVAVITNHSASALASGQTIGMQPVSDEEIRSLDAKREISPFEPLPSLSKKPRPPPPEAPEPLAGPRIAVGYLGTSYSDEVVFQHALHVGAAWVLNPGVLIGLDVVNFQPARSESEFVTLQIERTGVGLCAGWRLPFDPFALELEVGYMGEAVRRTILGTTEGIEGGDPDARWQSSLGTTLGAELAVTRALGIYAGVGLQRVLNNFKSIAIVDDEPQPVSTPHGLRATARAGLLLWP